MPPLLDTLAAELEHPRTLSAQVINHIIGTHSIARDEIGIFLENDFTKLEDYEVDLVLAPLFTPTLSDQSIFAALLESESVPASQWPGLIQSLTARPTRAQLVTEDGQTHAVPLRDVVIERFVNRLRLNGSISKPILDAITELAPATDQPTLKAIARRAIWEHASRAEILNHYLTATLTNNTYHLDDVVQLLKLVETYQPADQAELRVLIPHWLKVLQQEISEASGPKPFFNERVQDLHGGGRDQRRQDNSRVTAKENERAFLERLQTTLTQQP
jgi:hypothetical protein